MESKIAYISSEFALGDDLPIYAGGLGVLAGDILLEARRSNLPLIGISVFYREGFFKQLIDPSGKQQHFYDSVDPAAAGLADTGKTIEIPLLDHDLYLKIWKKETSKGGRHAHEPLFLLDGDIPENRPEDRKITDRLYERVWAPHLIDDLVLGIGSARAVRALKLPIKVWHINDDHGTLNIMERIREYMASGLTLEEAREKVKSETVFTTHTPVAGAESKFEKEEFTKVLTSLFSGLNVDLEEIWRLGERDWEGKKLFSLTVFSMRHARAVNAVSRKHFEISKELWKFIGEEVPTAYVTNGVYSPHWTPTELEDLWEKDPGAEEIKKAKLQAKTRASKEIGKIALDGKTFDPKALTLTWCRRFARYKQPNLLLTDLDRIINILTDSKRPVYLLVSGKAHPEDPEGQKFVKNIIEASRNPHLKNRLVYIPNYDLDVAHLLLTAADVWLNTPVVGWEASGTSGMKAIFNAALNASTPDGWWLEGFNGENGWVIEPQNEDYATPTYDLIEKEIAPTYYDNPEKWFGMVKEAYKTCGGKFDTKRVMEEYGALYGP